MKMLAVAGGAGLILTDSFFALATCTGLTLRAGGQKKRLPLEAKIAHENGVA